MIWCHRSGRLSQRINSTTFLAALAYVVLFSIGINFVRSVVSVQWQTRCAWVNSPTVKSVASQSEGAVMKIAALHDRYLSARDPVLTLKVKHPYCLIPITDLELDRAIKDRNTHVTVLYRASCQRDCNLHHGLCGWQMGRLFGICTLEGIEAMQLFIRYNCCSGICWIC